MKKSSKVFFFSLSFSLRVKMVQPPASEDSLEQEQHQHHEGCCGGHGAAEASGSDATNATAADVAVDDANAAQPSSSAADAPLSEEEKPLCVLVIGELNGMSRERVQ